MLLCASLRFSSRLPCGALFRSVAYHIFDMQCHCYAILLLAFPLPLVAFRRFPMQFHCSCNSKRFNSIPLRFSAYLGCAFPLLGIGLPINSSAFVSSAIPLPSTSELFYAIAYQLGAFQGNAVAYSVISSQLKRPIPEFRHCPIPLRQP